jgi:hypothetical protein
MLLKNESNILSLIILTYFTAINSAGDTRTLLLVYLGQAEKALLNKNTLNIQKIIYGVMSCSMSNIKRFYMCFASV